MQECDAQGARVMAQVERAVRGEINRIPRLRVMPERVAGPQLQRVIDFMAPGHLFGR